MAGNQGNYRENPTRNEKNTKSQWTAETKGEKQPGKKR